MHPFRSKRWSRAEPGAPRAGLIAGAAGLALAFGSPGAWAQAQPAPAAPTAPGPASAAPADPAEPVVVTASGAERRLFETPYAAGSVDVQGLRSAGPMVNLSEALARVPGIVVNNRSNYAQDLQINSRGFGARASFGVRGIRLYTDGIPASGPDGQGQVSHFDLAGAQRVEVLRGPFSALFGSSSGGVISLVSAPATERRLQVDGDLGSFGLRQLRVGLDAPLQGGFNLRAQLSRFETDGFRPQSSATRTLANVRLGWEGERDRVVVVLNTLDQPSLDPLGLTRAQFTADPDQTTGVALPQPAPGVADRFNTRKDTAQTQGGVSWRHRFGDGALQESQVAAYYGTRSVTQWQAIPVSTQANVRHPGGVIDFDRAYEGVDGRLVWRWALDDDRGLQLVAGASTDRSDEDRRGYENFTGAGAAQVLGVTGTLRRDERNRANRTDVYAQGEVDITTSVVGTLGVRDGRIRYRSSDRYIVGLNGDDSGATTFRYTTPVAAVQWRPSGALQVYVSAAQGFESPTFAELAYRPDANPGLNTGLKAQTSQQVEVGVKWRHGGRLGRPSLALDGAVFQADTKDEIVVATNQGGRQTFRNVGRTQRQGAELDLRATLAPQWRAHLALTWLDATYRDSFLVCAAAPCAAPTLPVPAGNRIAGTLARTAYAEIAWLPTRATEVALETRAQGNLPVNDLNNDFAAGFALMALRARWTLDLGPSSGKVELLGRIDNLADRRVVGSVIVNEGNSRFFEPAPGRNYLLSARWSKPF
jgi:iron complex outermembrane receptor protein